MLAGNAELFSGWMSLRNTQHMWNHCSLFPFPVQNAWFWWRRKLTAVSPQLCSPPIWLNQLQCANFADRETEGKKPLQIGHEDFLQFMYSRVLQIRENHFTFEPEDWALARMRITWNGSVESINIHRHLSLCQWLYFLPGKENWPLHMY